MESITMQQKLRRLAGALLALGWLGGGALVQAGAGEPQAKDIVLSSLSGRAATAEPSSRQAGMSVSVLVASAGGELIPRATDAPFRTGERFRLRVLPTVDGTLVIANTNPAGLTREVLRLPVRAGLEALVPAGAGSEFQLVGQAGEDVLHLSLYAEGSRLPPEGEAGAGAKDIRLVTQSTSDASYVVGDVDEPLYTRMVVRH
jgi:hypothetical protein